MISSKIYLIKRAVWYLLGFILIYAPFALIQRFLTSVLNIPGRADIHGSCFRMVVQGIFTGKGVQILTTSAIISITIFILAFFFGPVFCGKFCVAGAVTEYSSRILPDKIKLNWQSHINPTPVRYGVLAGFLLTPTLSLSVVCSFCNFSVMEKFILGGLSLDIGVLGSTTILTAFVWLFVLGIFAKGGRGYCSYLCPIGAVQSLIHYFGSKLPFTYKLKYKKEKCTNCNICSKDCPTGALQKVEETLKYNIHTCITCHQCSKGCPKSAISYGRGKSGWSVSKDNAVVEQNKSLNI